MDTIIPFEDICCLFTKDHIDQMGGLARMDFKIIFIDVVCFLKLLI
jgi:hypothetical protein